MTTGETGEGRDRFCGGAKRQGEGTCTRPAGWGTSHPGFGRCKLHGGSTPSHETAAQGQQADAALRKLWVGLDQAVPVKDPVASMERLAGALEQLVDEAGTRVSGLQHLAGGKDLTTLRAEVTLLERALGHLRQLLADMARLGIAERHVQLEQERASMVTAAFLAALGVVSLLPDDRQRVIEKFLDGLGQVPALEAGGAA